jgi:hypothetical protein
MRGWLHGRVDRRCGARRTHAPTCCVRARACDWARTHPRRQIPSAASARRRSTTRRRSTWTSARGTPRPSPRCTRYAPLPARAACHRSRDALCRCLMRRVCVRPGTADAVFACVGGRVHASHLRGCPYIAFYIFLSLCLYLYLYPFGYSYLWTACSRLAGISRCDEVQREHRRVEHRRRHRLVLCMRRPFRPGRRTAAAGHARRGRRCGAGRCARRRRRCARILSVRRRVGVRMRGRPRVQV